ncbi:hypothetical protein MUCCIDRAFT_78760 [Mucor lusitanicus CBS 277.49]|uniref:Uncharacterized protein n=1 Tax=Mucor lusitanicus CBS 277.49 TaxID=747725 RepID=A0A168NEX4_MUCCL|nr:hypothetical protein MUCCIDRAFT_78760 [Mucor lusitanicus CBS 277.49]
MLHQYLVESIYNLWDILILLFIVLLRVSLFDDLCTLFSKFCERLTRRGNQPDVRRESFLTSLCAHCPWDKANLIFYLFTYFWGGVVPIRFCITVITSAAWSSVLFLVDAVALVVCGFDEATEVLPWALNVEDAAVELYIRCLILTT